jgi:hypothetical protein
VARHTGRTRRCQRSRERKRARSMCHICAMPETAKGPRMLRDPF